jgi:hypothetical protein
MQNLGDRMSTTYAVIENGTVVNVVIADADTAAQNGWALLEGSAGIGWDYVDGQFVDNRPAPVTPVTTAPTKEQLLAQLQALQAQIQALE